MDARYEATDEAIGEATDGTASPRRRVTDDGAWLDDARARQVPA